MYSREEIIDVLKNITGIDADIDYDTKLIKYGIESLSIMKLVGNFRKSGYRVKFADLMENPTVNAWYELLENIDAKKKNSKKEINKQTSDVIVKASEDDYNDKEPFDITDVQYAYLIGRDDEQILGGVDCHAYYEFKGINVSLDKLSDAWIKLQLKHRALRTVFIDGKQFVRDEIYKDNYHVIDVSDKSNSEVENECERIRNHISHRKLDIENGEVAGLTICLLPENVHIIYLDFALIVADVKSIQIMLRDLANIYVGKENAEIVNDWNFKKYNILQNKARRAEKEEAVKYWEKMVESMPLIPDLPLKKGSHEIKKIKNTHYTQIIKANAWKRFSEKSKKSEVTAPMALLTAYAQTIEKWSNNKEFLINVPLFDRAAEYEGIENAVGDFTTLLLTSHDFNERKSFEDRIKITQSNFVRDMHYAACSGVEVQRMLQKKHIKQREFAPVVFACNIGLAEHRLSWLKNIVDRVVYLKKGAIVFDESSKDFYSRSNDNLNELGLRGIVNGTDYLNGPIGFYSLNGDADYDEKEKYIFNDFEYKYEKNKKVIEINDLEVPKNAVVAVVGHNGAGKSTFSKCLCGIQKGFKGNIQINNKKYKGKKLRTLCYMVMQDVNHQLFTDLVIEEVVLGMEYENEEYAMKVLEKMDLVEFKDRHPMSLSGGQKQRTAICSAYLSNRDIIILDEPTSGLDYSRMEETANLIKEISNDKTVFIVTHDAELIEKCCTHILHIEKPE